jgi:hypothetical protein
MDQVIEQVIETSEEVVELSLAELASAIRPSAKVQE